MGILNCLKPAAPPDVPRGRLPYRGYIPAMSANAGMQRFVLNEANREAVDAGLRRLVDANNDSNGDEEAAALRDLLYATSGNGGKNGRREKF